jgi:hypothetical protein
VGILENDLPSGGGIIISVAKLGFSCSYATKNKVAEIHWNQYVARRFII